MSVGTYEIGGIQQVPQEQIDAIISGDVPRSVAEIDAVSMYVNAFVPQWPGLNKIDEPIAYLRRNGDDLSFMNPGQYALAKELGNRDTWRLTQEDRRDFEAIAFHTSVDEIPTDYLALFVKINGNPEATAAIRQQALDKLNLASHIDEVEQVERMHAETTRARALLDSRRAMRLTPLTETVFTQETVALPTIAPAAPRLTEVRSHRVGYERPKQGMVSRALGFVANKFYDYIGVAKFA